MEVSGKSDCDDGNRTTGDSPTSKETSPVKEPTPLCGYLNKLATKSLIKSYKGSYKRRWFVFSESDGRLYYYKDSEDTQPLGFIDITSASFYLEITNVEKPGLFVVRTPDREYCLEAQDRQAGLYWLQELQKWRKAFNLKKSQNINVDLQDTTVTQTCSGLLCQEQTLAQEESSSDCELMTPVDCPRAVVGEHTAALKSPHYLGFKFVDFKNQVTALVHKKPYQSSEGHVEEDVKPRSNSQFFVDLSEENKEEQLDEETPLSPKSKGAPGFKLIRKRLQDSFRVRPREEGDVKMPVLRRGPSELKCLKCREFDAELSVMREELQSREDELSASREVIKVLRHQLDLVHVERETLMKLNSSSEKNSFSHMLTEKDKQILELRNELYSVKVQLDKSNCRNRSIEEELTDVKDRSSLYEEVIKEKDRMVVSLSNELQLLEKKDNSSIASVTTMGSSVSAPSMDSSKLNDVFEEEEMVVLKDSLAAYKIQNKFLNKEILELNDLRWNAEGREKNWFMKFSDAEAKRCRIQSKLLFLLKLLKSSQKEGKEEVQEAVDQLLIEAMHDFVLPVDQVQDFVYGSNETYDRFGFNKKWGKDEEDILTSKAESLKQRSEEIMSRLQDPVIAIWRDKWKGFMDTTKSKDIFSGPESKELKELIRTGIPDEYRSTIWKGCIQRRIRSKRLFLGPGYYENLLTSSTRTSKLDPAEKQIELDLLRTLPNNKHYETADSPGIMSLRRVLLAYSRHNTAVGYCQGLNRLAAIALLFMKEEDAFWCLVAIVEDIMPRDYYNRTLIASQVDQRVLKDLMAEKLPRLHTHLENNKVDHSLFTFNWFLTVFVDTIPVQTYLYIWDVFLNEGTKVLFRFTLAIFKMFEAEILQQDDYMSINRYLRTIAERVTNVKELAQIAFQGLNPFPMRSINTKRNFHMQAVQAQLNEIEAIRRALPLSDPLHFKESGTDED